MTSLVLDGSMAVSWCFEDEATAQTDAILAQVRRDGALLSAARATGVATLTG